MGIYDKINSLIEEYFNQGDYYTLYIEVDGNDLEIDEEIKKIFEENNIEQFNVELEQVFDSPGLDIYYLAVAWIEDGDLQVYNLSMEIY